MINTEGCHIKHLRNETNLNIKKSAAQINESVVHEIYAATGLLSE